MRTHNLKRFAYQQCTHPSYFVAVVLRLVRRVAISTNLSAYCLDFDVLKTVAELPTRDRSSADNARALLSKCVTLGTPEQDVATVDEQGKRHCQECLTPARYDLVILVTAFP